MGVARQGQRGTTASPEMPRNRFLTKNCATSLYFSAQTLAYSGHGHSGVRSAPSNLQDKLMATPVLHTYDLYYKSAGCCWHNVGI